MTAISRLIDIFSYAVALCGIAPLFPWLTAAPRLILAAGLIAGVWQSVRGPWQLKSWALNIAVLLFFLLYLAGFTASNLVQSAVALLAIMLAVRLAGEKNSRYYLQIMTLSLLCLASSSLFELNPMFLFYLVVIFVLIAISLVLLAFYDQDGGMIMSKQTLRRILTAGFLTALASVPLMFILFPILPRTQIPLWNVYGAPPTQQAGFSERVEPGRGERVNDSRRIVFRAEMPPRLRQDLYWRATVFNRIEMTRWVRGVSPAPELPKPDGVRVSQIIYPEPGFSRFLVGLDIPAHVAAFRVRWNPDLVWEQRLNTDRRLSYRVDSTIGGFLPVVDTINRDFYLQLPERVSQSFWAVSGRIRREGQSDEKKLELLEEHFRKGGYRYSAQGLPVGEDALETFFAETKSGNCEFFASSFALLARLSGIPARLVGGYLGGEYNDVGGYYLVTEGMAHVWVELFLEGEGWRRVDPSLFAVNADAVWNAPKHAGFLQRLRMILDSLEYIWSRSVVSYDFERQLSSVRFVTGHMRDLQLKRPSGGVALPFAAALVITFIATLALKRRVLFPRREELLLKGFYRRLERDCGVAVQPDSQGVFDLASLAGCKRAREFADIYASAIYRDRKLTDDEYIRLKKLLKLDFNSAADGKTSEKKHTARGDDI